MAHTKKHTKIQAARKKKRAAVKNTKWVKKSVKQSIKKGNYWDSGGKKNPNLKTKKQKRKAIRASNKYNRSIARTARKTKRKTIRRVRRGNK